MDSKEDKTMQTTSIMNIIFKYNLKYTKYVSSGCLQKKTMKNMNDNISFVIKRLKQDLMVYIKLLKLD